MRLPDFASTTKRFRWIAGSTLGAVIVAGGVLITMALMPTPKPDVWDDGLDDVAGFFFDEDFNRLPPMERLKLLQEFTARFRDGGQEETAMLAMFVADVTYDMRKQVEDNVMKLGVDLWSQWGAEYEQVEPDQREEYLYSLFIELDKIGDGFNGRESDRSDGERMEGIHRQADRDREQMREWSGNKPPSMDQVSGILDFYQSEIGERAGAVERGRIMKLTRDLARYARGESVEDGDG